MAKLLPDAIIDLALGVAEGTKMHVCAGAVLTYANAVSNELASVTISGVDYTKANGDTSGRKNTLAAKSGLSITATGSADHIAITNGTDTLYIVTTCPTTALTSGGTVDVGAWAHEIRDLA